MEFAFEVFWGKSLQLELVSIIKDKQSHFPREKITIKMGDRDMARLKTITSQIKEM